jgi:predicted DsbA family dithiol-disulfide isomerase
MFSFKKKRKIPIVAALAVLALLVFGTIFLFGGFLFFSNLNTDNGTNNVLTDHDSSGDLFVTKGPGWHDPLSGPIIDGSDPSLGAASAKINLVQFADYSCGYSRQQADIIKKALADYAGKIKFIRKDYPADKNDSASYQAAIAARCAGEQGKYWEYYDELIKDNKQLNQEKFLAIATNLSLNKNIFLACQTGDGVKKLIAANIEEANNLQISGVPFIFVNKQESLGEISYEDLKRMIDVELSRK